MASRVLIAALFAVLLLGTVSGCGMYAHRGPSDLAPSSSSARATGLDSLTLAGYSGSGNPPVGAVLRASQYEVFLTGHVDSAIRSVTDDSSAGSTEVDVALDTQGTNALLTWTTGHIGRWIIVLLNGRVVSAQLLDKQIPDGRITIPVDPSSAVGQELLQAVPN